MWVPKPFKAPRLDGLHVGFFQRFWLLLGESMKNEMKLIFNARAVPEYLNKTLIIFIPKCKNPESLNNYRPISLCSTIYKVVTKIIMARIGLCFHVYSPLCNLTSFQGDKVWTMRSLSRN